LTTGTSQEANGWFWFFADMQFELGPADEEFLESDEFKSGKERLQFEWGIVGGAIDKNYAKANQRWLPGDDG
jgi:elongation factor G